MEINRHTDQNFRSRFKTFEITRENPTSPYPAVIVPGFANDASAYMLPLQILNHAGFNALCPDYQYGISGQRKKFGIFTDVDGLKQEALSDILDKYGYENEEGIKQVNLVGHSDGARKAIDFAAAHPESVRNLILVAPGGIRRHRLVMTTLKAYKKGEIGDAKDKVKLSEEYPEIAGMISENEAYKAWYKTKKLYYGIEGFVMMMSTVQGKLPQIRKNEVKVGVIAPLQDSMFPLEEYARYMTTKYIDEFMPVSGIHGEIKFRKHIAVEVADMIKRFENRR